MSSGPINPQSTAVLRSFMDGANEQYRKAGFPDMQVKVRADGSIDKAPGAPRAAKALPGEDGITVLWKPAKDDHGSPKAYRIYRDGSHIATVKGSDWFTDTRARGRHDYEVRAVDSSGTEGGSAAIPLAGGKRLAKAGRVALAQALQSQGGAPAASSGASQAAAGAGKLATPALTGLQQGGPDAFRVQWKPVKGAAAYGIYQDGQLLGQVGDPSFAAKLDAGTAVTLEIDAVSASGVRSARTAAIQLAIGPDGKLQAAKAPQGAPEGRAAATPVAPATPAAPAAPAAPATDPADPAAPASMPATPAPAPAPAAAAPPAPPAATAPESPATTPA